MKVCVFFPKTEYMLKKKSEIDRPVSKNHYFYQNYKAFWPLTSSFSVKRDFREFLAAPPSFRSTWFIDHPSGGTSSAKSYSNGSQQIVPISRFSHCIWVQKEAPILSINIGLQRLRTQNCLNGHFGTLLTLESRKRSRKYLAELAITISMTADRVSKES